MRGRQAGFTLIEVLVALAIAALGLGALMAAAGTGLGNVALAGQYTEAMRRAQSHLAMVGAVTALAQGDQSGDDGGGYSWRIRISPPLVRPAGNGAPPPALYAVEVTIGWKSGSSAKSVSLQSQRLGRPPDVKP